LFLSGAVAADWPELQRIEKTGDAMGAMYSIVLYGDDRAKMEAAADAAFDEVGRLDGMLSNYRAGSEWNELNRHAAEGPVKVSPECSSCSRPASRTAGRVKGLSTSRWAR
jgi:thiamine biosynthesis lipoprotein